MSEPNNSTTDLPDSLPADFEAAGQQQLAGRLTMVLLLVAPFVFFGTYFAAALHELAHGVMALLVGGQFKGFQLLLNGMGIALGHAPYGAPAWKTVAINLAGVTVTTVVGLALMAAGYRLRRHPAVALPLLALAFHCMLEGPPYLLWNAINPVGPGDIGQALFHLYHPLWRVGFIVIGGLLTAGATWFLTALLFVIVQAWVAPVAGLHGPGRVIVLGFLAGVPAVMMFLFAWDDLAQGLGQMPNVVGAGMNLAAGLSIYGIDLRIAPVHSSLRATVIVMALGWALAISSGLLVGLWLGYGVYW